VHVEVGGFSILARKRKEKNEGKVLEVLLLLPYPYMARATCLRYIAPTHGV